MNGQLTYTAASLLVTLCLPQLSCGQPPPPVKPAGRAQALKEAKVSSAGGWREAVSDEGRFRVRFPREPEPVDATGMLPEVLGLQLEDGATLWHAVYKDLSYEPPGDPAEIRETYRQVFEGATSPGDGRLLSHTDVVLNGRLGADLVFEGPGEQSYIRTFFVGRRIYLLQVDYTKGRGGEPPLQKDVKQFFESFTFWE